MTGEKTSSPGHRHAGRNRGVAPETPRRDQRADQGDVSGARTPPRAQKGAHTGGHRASRPVVLKWGRAKHDTHHSPKGGSKAKRQTTDLLTRVRRHITQRAPAMPQRDNVGETPERPSAINGLWIREAARPHAHKGVTRNDVGDRGGRPDL